MGISKDKSWKWVFTLLFGLAVFLFWRYRYEAALTYQEQCQLFLFGGDYLSTRLAQPGGLARYVAEFLVQFYNNITYGALILAVLFMLIQRLTWHMTLRMSASVSPLAYTLSFVPVCLLWYYMGDLSVMHTFAVSLAVAMAMTLAWPDGKKANWAYILVAIPIIYWVAGPAVWMVALFLLLYRLSAKDGCNTSYIHVLLAVLMTLACILGSAVFVPYPLHQLFRGIDYFRIPLFVPLMQFVVMIMMVVVPYLCRSIPEKCGVKGSAVLSVIVIIIAVFCIPRGFDAKTYELIEYDYLARTQQWDAIVNKAERQQPDLPMNVSATNLALAMRGELCDRMFHFYQKGVQGLVPNFERNFSTIPLTGEIYWQLGMVNTAQCYAFEAMEAIPNGNKSCRSVKRLAETNMVNGQYDVANKYFDMLEKTVFYRAWAKRTRQLMSEEKAINDHPLYGRLRQWHLEEDFLFSQTEMDKMMGQLFLKDKSNTMAMQYLLAIPMLDGNSELLAKYMEVVNTFVNYHPVACQQALAHAYAIHRQQPPAGLISDMVLRQFNDFSQSYGSMGAPERFKGTYWYYITQKH